MLVAVLSAVHANLAALEAALNEIAVFRPQRIFALGEVVPGGPQAAEVTQLLSAAPGVEWIRAPALAATLLVRGERHTVLRVEAGDDVAAIVERAHPSALILEGLDRASIEQRRDTLLICTGVVGGVAEGDPRPSFVLLVLDSEPKVRAWIERVDYDPSLLLDAVDRGMAQGSIDTRAAEKFLRSLLGKEAGALPPLHRADRGSTALVKLLSPRIRDVYRRASEKNGLAEPEQVHVVRVATRRLRAALAFAKPMMAERAAERSRNQLQILGRALGKKRAADVMLQHLEALPPSSDVELEVLREMYRLNEARRRRAARLIFRDHDRPALIREGVALLGAMMCPVKDGPRLWAVVKKELENRAKSVHATFDALEHRHDDEAHHELRIALKRLRYACEIADPPFPELKAMELAERIKPLQEALGELHDRVEVLSFVKSARVARRAPKEGIESLSARLIAEREERLKEAERRFSSDGAAILQDLDAALSRLGSR